MNKALRERLAPENRRQPLPQLASKNRVKNGKVFSTNSMRPGSLLLWIGPSAFLIVAVVLFPLFETIRASFQSFSITGAVAGWAGFDNFLRIFREPQLAAIALNTLIWVVGGVLFTTLLALPIGQLLSKTFPGRRLLRIALIVPWATSIVMTAIGFRWLLNYYYGVLNPFLLSLHVIEEPIDWLGNDSTVGAVMVGVVIFVSLPFTSFAVLSGLNAVPPEVLEAAQVDGATTWQSYRLITLPLLRQPVMVTILLNTIWIFNSFPIIYVLNKSNPGYSHDITTTFMYKIAFLTERDIGAGAAMAVLNVVFIAFFVALYVRKARID